MHSILPHLRRARWVHAVQLIVFTFWVMNPFPGALSYWTDSNNDGVKEEVGNPEEGASWWGADSDGDTLINEVEVMFGSDQIPSPPAAFGTTGSSTPARGTIMIPTASRMRWTSGRGTGGTVNPTSTTMVSNTWDPGVTGTMTPSPIRRTPIPMTPPMALTATATA
ncbi:hypothetical protein [Prosthecobacter sp.]|uniref:hypothetical protein n=1 Tax=Prosthecobacter sp. TaxID=1965333 RepID=UPI0025EA19B3|nr:hypothetical protein [Prosthecobacter sp.]